MDQALATVIIDAIDSLTPKLELLCATVMRNIPVISSMGAALRTDPTAVRVTPLQKTTICPLAKLIRKKLRQRKISTDFLCVYSTEPLGANAEKAICDEKTSEPHYYSRGRQRRILGSLPTVTAAFGQTAATAAINLILNTAKPIHVIEGTEKTGEQGFEPRLTDPESVVLPLHYSPKTGLSTKFNLFCISKSANGRQYLYRCPMLWYIH